MRPPRKINRMKMASSNIYTSNFRRCYSATVPRRVRSVVARVLLTRLPDKHRVRTCSSRVTRESPLWNDVASVFSLSVFTLQFTRNSDQLRDSKRQYFRRALARISRSGYGVINRINGEEGGSRFAPASNHRSVTVLLQRLTYLSS